MTAQIGTLPVGMVCLLDEDLCITLHVDLDDIAEELEGKTVIARFEPDAPNLTVDGVSPKSRALPMFPLDTLVEAFAELVAAAKALPPNVPNGAALALLNAESTPDAVEAFVKLCDLAMQAARK